MGNVSAGNASLNNASLNNVSANKTDTSSNWADPNTHKVELAQGTAAFDRSAGQMTAINVRKSDLGVSSDTANMNAVQDANNFGTSSVATNASTLATNSGVQSVSGSGVTNSVNRDDGWSVTRNSGTTYGTNESTNYGTVNSSAFGSQSSRNGSSQNQFQYSSGVALSAGASSTFNTNKPTQANSSNSDNADTPAIHNGTEQSSETNGIELLNVLSTAPSAIGTIVSFAKTNKGRPNHNIPSNKTAESISMNQTELFRLNAGPTGTTAAMLADVTGLTTYNSRNSTYQTGNSFSVNELTGENSSVINGTRNVLSDSTNAQFSEQHGLNEGRSTTDSNSDLESANHTATSGKSNNVTQDRENLVRDLGLALAGGDAFEALRTFNSSSGKPCGFECISQPKHA